MKPTIAMAVLIVAGELARSSQSAPSSSPLGSARGTVVLVSESNDKFIRTAPHVTLIFSGAKTKREARVEADDLGDFRIELPAARYCVSAVNATNETLRLSSHQVKCFKIKAHQERRFDVMLASSD